MTAVSVLGALGVMALRVWVIPAKQDLATGLFSSNRVVIILTLMLLGALAAMLFVVRGGDRQEIKGKPSLILSVMVLATGAALFFTGVADLWSGLSNDTMVLGDNAGLSNALSWLERIFCVLGGASLVRLGLVLASENTTRRGAAQWSLLAPVMWMWMVLANYVMSYNSMVRPAEGFFSLTAYCTELLFLFYFARYIAGVGHVGSVTLLFFSGSATLCALSAPAVKLIMYLLGDGAGYAAAGVTGVLDLLVGLLALTVSITLCQSMSAPVEEPKEEEEAVDWSSVASEAEAELLDSSEEAAE